MFEKLMMNLGFVKKCKLDEANKTTKQFEEFIDAINNKNFDIIIAGSETIFENNLIEGKRILITPSTERVLISGNRFL